MSPAPVLRTLLGPGWISSRRHQSSIDCHTSPAPEARVKPPPRTKQGGPPPSTASRGQAPKAAERARKCTLQNESDIRELSSNPQVVRRFTVPSLLGPPLHFVGTPRGRRSARRGRSRNVRRVAHCCPWSLSALRRGSPPRVPPHPNHRAQQVSEDAPAGRLPAAASWEGRSRDPYGSPGVRRCGRRVPRNQDRSSPGFPHRAVRRRTQQGLRVPRNPERESLSLQQSCDFWYPPALGTHGGPVFTAGRLGLSPFQDAPGSRTEGLKLHGDVLPGCRATGCSLTSYGSDSSQQRGLHGQSVGIPVPGRHTDDDMETHPYAFNWAATTPCSDARGRSVGSSQVEYQPLKPGPRVQGDPFAGVEPDLHTGAIVWKRQKNAGPLQI